MAEEAEAEGRRRGHFGEHGCRRGRRRWWWGRRRRRRHDERRLGRQLDRRCRRRVRSGGTGGGAGVGERLRTLGRSRCSEQNVEDLAVVGQWRRARGAGVRNRTLEPVGLGPACVGMGDRRLLAADTVGVRQSRRPVHSCRGGTEFGRQDGIEGTGTQLDHRSGGEDFLFERRNVEDWFGYVCLHRWFWHACCSAPCPLRRGLDARDVTVGRTGRVLESGTGILDGSGPRTASHDRCCTQFRQSGPLGRLRRPDPARGTEGGGAGAPRRRADGCRPDLRVCRGACRGAQRVLDPQAEGFDRSGQAGLAVPELLQPSEDLVPNLRGRRGHRSDGATRRRRCLLVTVLTCHARAIPPGDPGSVVGTSRSRSCTPDRQRRTCRMATRPGSKRSQPTAEAESRIFSDPHRASARRTGARRKPAPSVPVREARSGSARGVGGANQVRRGPRCGDRRATARRWPLRHIARSARRGATTAATVCPRG